MTDFPKRLYKNTGKEHPLMIGHAPTSYEELRFFANKTMQEGNGPEQGMCAAIVQLLDLAEQDREYIASLEARLHDSDTTQE